MRMGGGLYHFDILLELKQYQLIVDQSRCCASRKIEAADTIPVTL